MQDAIVLYDFFSRNQYELDVKVGEKVKIKPCIIKWCEAFTNSRSGFIPENYIQVLKASVTTTTTSDQPMTSFDQFLNSANFVWIGLASAICTICLILILGCALYVYCFCSRCRKRDRKERVFYSLMHTFIGTSKKSQQSSEMKQINNIESESESEIETTIFEQGEHLKSFIKNRTFDISTF